MTTNIGRDNSDASFRYKMPILTTKIEGRGNGIKTVIPNMNDIAKALHIHPAYPTKFFGIELGAQSKYSVDTERCVVNGSHMAPDLAKILDRFIQQFILCPKCKLPELKMSIKSSSIKIDCAACGDQSQIKSSHRLVQYMLKNPPKSFSEDSSSKGDKDKKKKKKSKGSDDDDLELDEESASVVAAAKAGGSSSAVAAEDGDAAPEKEKKKKEKKEKKDRKDETPEERAARKAKKAAKKEKKEKKEKKSKKEKEKAESDEEEGSSDEEETKSEKTEKAPKESKAEDNEDDEEENEDDDDESDDGDASGEWHTDTSKAAVRKRQEAEFAEMLAGAKRDVENIVISAKADNKSDSPVTILKIFLASKPRTPNEISAELRRLAMSRGLDEPQKLKVLLEAIIDITTPKTVVEQFKKHTDLLKYFTSSSSSSSSSENRNTGTTLLTCIEDLIGVVERKLLPYAPMIMKTLYEEEVLEEPTLISWYDAPPEASWLVNKEVAAEVRSKAKPFIEWLKNAEEEESDEE